jgi:hypothetical protein
MALVALPALIPPSNTGVLTPRPTETPTLVVTVDGFPLSSYPTSIPPFILTPTIAFIPIPTPTELVCVSLRH